MSPIAVVSGYLIRCPLGGHVLSILHWLVGLQKLGYDVVFVEHHGWTNACYNPQTDSLTDDPSYGIAEIRQLFEQFGIRRWCYVDSDNVYHGLSSKELRALCCDSEVMISLWTPTWIDELFECPRRVFIDTDPGFTQFTMQARSGSGYASPFDFHYHFTYGTRIGQPDCPIPTLGLTWLPTRPPIVLDLLPVRYTPEAELFTTVMSWSTRAPIVFECEEYGQKDIEFWRIVSLPSRVGPIFELALGGVTAPREKIAAAGWRIADPRRVTATPWAYRDYIAQSRGEFSVAVNLEVKTRSGWFSDRSAAYLASGKPVIVQDTGFSEDLPCGQGLLAFRTIEDAATAVELIATDYRAHCSAARRIAEQYFDAHRVVGDILQTCGVEAAIPHTSDKFGCAF